MSSLINFLNSQFKPTVETKAACENGFTAGNLVAEDPLQLERGFMGFSVYKLPVEIVFDFPKAVDMKVIKLWPSNGALRSTAFELHARHNGNWELVAFVKDLRHNVDSVNFCYQGDCSSSSSSSSIEVFFLKSARKILTNTSSIKVVILATEGCPPVLRKVQMLGLAARSVDKADREQVKRILNRNWESTSIPQLKEESILTIPDEFLDCITLELMMYPTVLPSSKVVDQSTIDRYAAEEAKWGRQPSDPFTGLEFNTERKPKVYLALKRRIEEFILRHSEHFKTVPRYLEASWMRRHFRKEAVDSIKQQQAKKRAAESTSLSPAAKKAKLSHEGTKASFTLSFSSSASTSCSSIGQSIEQATFSTSLGSPSRCVSCRSAQFHYEILTCRHVVCRDCLAALMRNQVCACKFSFQAADVKLYQIGGCLKRSLPVKSGDAKKRCPPGSAHL